VTRNYLTKVYKSEQEKWIKLEATHEQLERYTDDLNKDLLGLESASLDTIHRLVLAAQYRDEHIGDHIVPIGRTIDVSVKIERRKHPRIAVRWPISVVTRDGIIEGETRNISLGGILLCSEKPLPLNEP